MRAPPRAQPQGVAHDPVAPRASFPVHVAASHHLPTSAPNAAPAALAAASLPRAGSPLVPPPPHLAVNTVSDDDVDAADAAGDVVSSSEGDESDLESVASPTTATAAVSVPALKLPPLPPAASITEVEIDLTAMDSDHLFGDETSRGMMGVKN